MCTFKQERAQEGPGSTPSYQQKSASMQKHAIVGYVNAASNELASKTITYEVQ
jgi:hypothetical protein